MRLRTPITSTARRTTLALSLAALLAAAAACDPDGASKKQAAARDATTPAGAQPPRTSLPMPPVATAHGTSSSAAPSAAPRGAWTQSDGRRAALADYHGQVVVLDFWATYCPPCREEI